MGQMEAADKPSSPAVEGGECSVFVATVVRPLLPHELADGCKVAVHVVPNEPQVCKIYVFYIFIIQVCHGPLHIPKRASRCFAFSCNANGLVLACSFETGETVSSNYE